MAMRMKTCLFCAVLALAAVGFTAARAEEFGAYRLEAGLHLEFQSDTVLAAVPNVDAGLADVRVRYHFAELPEDEPVNEQAFLGHVPFAGVRMGKLSLGGAVDESDGFFWGLEGRYAAENVPVAADFFFRTGKLDEDDGDQLDVGEFGLNVGYWLQSNLEVGVSFGSMKAEDPDLVSSETKSFGVYAKTVREMGGRTVNLEVELASVDYTFDLKAIPGVDDEGKNFRFAVGGDCYLGEGLSVGGAIVSNSGDYADAEGLGFEARIAYNHGTALGVELAVVRFKASGAGVQNTTAGRILVVYRR